jgi:hypothetical protein
MIVLAIALALAAGVAAATALRLRAAQERRPPAPVDDAEEAPLRLRQIADILGESEHSEFGVDRSLRPLLVPIVNARLGRRGVDAALAPERASELLGERLWEIVRPDRAPAGHRRSHGLGGDELRAVLDRLEQL